MTLLTQRRYTTGRHGFEHVHTRQARGRSRFLRFQCQFPAISPWKILLPDIGSCIFYDRLRYTGPLTLKKRARGQIEKAFLAKSLSVSRLRSFPQHISVILPFIVPVFEDTR